jgi:hypothetical protein
MERTLHQSPATGARFHGIASAPHVGREQSAWYKALTAWSRAAARLVPPGPLSPRRWVEDARRAAGLDDFGAEFGDAESGLGAWVSAVEREGDVSPIGRMIIRYEMTRILAGRLAIVDVLRKNRGIAEAPIDRPLFVIGLPRSGTTLLHRLLALDPGWRAPRLWELLHTAPPRVFDDRRLRTEWQLRIVEAMVPEFRAVHPAYADEPEECVVATTATFRSMQLVARARAPSYVRWLLGEDARPVYRYHRAVLSVLGHGETQPRWVLKAPEHLFWLDGILDVYPDARFVHLHRDPVEVAPSGCSLHTIARRVLTERLRRPEMGREWLDLWQTGITRAIAARQRILPGRLLDVSYLDLVADPAAVVRRVHAFAGVREAADVEREVSRFLAQNPAGKHGKHAYTLAEFGLTAGEVRERFADYWDRFGGSSSG